MIRFFITVHVKSSGFLITLILCGVWCIVLIQIFPYKVAKIIEGLHAMLLKTNKIKVKLMFILFLILLLTLRQIIYKLVWYFFVVWCKVFRNIFYINFYKVF